MRLHPSVRLPSSSRPLLFLAMSDDAGLGSYLILAQWLLPEVGRAHPSKECSQPGMVVPTYHSSSVETEAGTLQVQGPVSQTK